MNTKLTLTAIAMFAVMMSLSMYSPAMAAKEIKYDVCHFEEEQIILEDTNGDGVIDENDTPTVIPAEWKVININGNSLSAHLGVHGDGVNVDQLIDDSAEPAEDTVSTEDCLARNTT
ncbi:MAG TPA: hypothetical protein VD699_00885 [Nitrosopumilaceae archaeon]|nr:hypothetical protein [Nitrosopumilaceae archaeon]